MKSFCQSTALFSVFLLGFCLVVSACGGGSGGGAYIPTINLSGFGVYTDQNMNGACDAGDKIVLTFSSSLVLNSPTVNDFSLTTTGDTFGTGATVAAGPLANQVTITLGTGSCVLKSRQDYTTTLTAANSPSGIDISATMTENAIESLGDGYEAVPSTPVDIVPGFISSGQSLGTAISSDVALGDLDGDGDLDMVDADWGNANRVFINDGSGTYADSGQSLGSSITTGVALGDLDRDGDLDLVEANTLWGANKVWTNDGSGAFSDSGQSLGASYTQCLALGDVNGDGDLDLFAGNVINPAKIYTNNGSGVFSDSGQSIDAGNINSAAFGDVDGDGDLDLFTGVMEAANVLWLNNGDGVFTLSNQALGANKTRSIFLGDIDNDRDLDLVAGNQEGGNLVWLNNGAGVFENSGQVLGDTDTYEVIPGDYDGDGDLDFVEVSYSLTTDHANKVWINNGTGEFSDSGMRFDGTNTICGALGDVDEDGDLDLVEGNMAGAGPQVNLVWLNSLTGTWGSVTLADTGQELGSQMTFENRLADLDGDGDLDLLKAVYQGAEKLWWNDGHGEFTASGQSLGTSKTISVAAGDLDRDGDVDFVVGNGDTDPDEVWINDGNGVFVNSGQTLGTWNNLTIHLNDVDRDGDLDIVSASLNRIDTYLNNGSASFTPTSTNATSIVSSMDMGDLNGNGYPDLVLGRLNGNNLIFMNAGAGVFNDSGQSLSSAATNAVTLADVEGDGDLDILEGIMVSATNRIWFNDGSGTFNTATTYDEDQDSGYQAVGDVDGDGDIDILTANWGAANKLWLNDGLGAFTDSGLSLGTFDTGWGVLGDIDRDGDLDYVTANFDQPDRVWINR